MDSLTDKVAIVTGGSEGIGRAVAIAFAQAGAKVVVNSRTEEEINEVVKEIGSLGGEAIGVVGDVGIADDVEHIVAKALDTYGALHFACNNAGINGDVARLADGSEQNFDSVLQTNVKGVWLSMKYEIPAILKAGGGSIVNIASISGITGIPGFSVYSASKHAVIGMSKSAALDYGEKGIRINAVAPGAVETNLLDSYIEKLTNFQGSEVSRDDLRQGTPLKKIGKPEEIASMVVWLCSDGAAFTTGQTFTIDGGVTV